jgi:PKD repeat protein
MPVMIRFLPVLTLGLFLPLSALAQVVITEIMYDLEGGDSGREWIEVRNEGGSAINFSGWKLYEGETNHKLNEVKNGTILQAGEYAIVADDAVIFLSEWPGYDGVLFDSSFSLKNTGETLIFRDGNLVDQSMVTYSSDRGGAGDGTSLQLFSGDWVSAVPTPGATAAGEGTPKPQVVETSSPNTTAENTMSPDTFVWPDTQELHARITAGNVAIVGAAAVFKGEALGLQDKVLKNAYYSWSFGDGNSNNGQNVLHTFTHPGEYVIFLTVTSGEFSTSARLTVTVVPAEVSLSDIVEGKNGFIELYNEGAHEINLTSWSVVAHGLTFIFPLNTIILPQSRLKFSALTTGLFADARSAVTLHYPNGTVAARFKEGAVPRATSTIKADGLKIPSSPKTASKVSSKPNIPSTVERNDPVSEAVIEGTTTSVPSAEASVVRAADNPASKTTTRIASGSIYTWLLALTALIGGAVASVVVMRRRAENEITIIE